MSDRLVHIRSSRSYTQIQWNRIAAALAKRNPGNCVKSDQPLTPSQMPSVVGAS